MFGSVVKGEIFLFLTLVAMFFSKAEQFAHFDRVHYEEHFCEIILNLVVK